MVNVLQRDVEEHPDVAVAQRVEGHPTGAPDFHDSTRSQEAQRVRGGGLAHPRRRSEVTHAELAAFEERDEQSHPSRVSHQSEYFGQLLDRVCRRERSSNGLDPTRIHEAVDAGVQRLDLCNI